MYVQPFDGQLAQPSIATLTGADAAQNAITLGLGPAALAVDDIARFAPPLTSALTGSGSNATTDSQILTPSQFNPLASMMQQLMAMLQSIMGGGSLGSGTYAPGTGTYAPGTGTCQPYGNEQYFQNATAGSEGDPHLSFNGNKWTSMASQPNLLNSDSIAGGYQVSTQTTQPNAKGVAFNQSATVALNGGATSVSMSNTGQASISAYGQNVPISAGQTVQLGNGQSVTCNQNGSLTIEAQNGNGGQISTTLTANGRGVDVDVNAQNVDLGGALVNGPQGTTTGTVPQIPTTWVPNPLAPGTLPTNPWQNQQVNPLLETGL